MVTDHGGGWAQVAVTGLSVTKLQDRTQETPADYSAEIQAGLNYIFGQADVDPYGPGTGISFDDFEETYQTGIALMAIANDGDPGQVVNVAGSEVDGMTYQAVMEGVVLYFASSQNANGGWGYEGPPGDWSDQSNTGYAVLGISYADAAGITIPASIGTGLDNWISYIQTSGGPDDGGSGYGGPGDWVNELKTGNLIFQMSYRGMGPGDAAFDRAIAYIERHWQDMNLDPGWGYGAAPHYQAMYCLMKGLTASSVDMIDTDGDTLLEDWFNQEPPASPAQDFATILLANQLGDGSWPGDYWIGDPAIATAWALLTLEKVTVINKYTVEVDVKPGSYPSSVNLKNKGLTPVAIHTTEDFDAADIDPMSVVLDPDGCFIMPVKAELDDCDEIPNPLADPANPLYDPAAPEMIGDGDVDLVLFFVTADLACLGDVTEVAIGGLTYDGIPIEGTSDISFVKQGKP